MFTFQLYLYSVNGEWLSGCSSPPPRSASPAQWYPLVLRPSGGPSAFCQNLLSGKSLINPFTQRAASCALSPGNINNLTGNKGKEQNVRTTARTRSAPEISFLYTECLGSHLLSCLASPQQVSQRHCVLSVPISIPWTSNHSTPSQTPKEQALSWGLSTKAQALAVQRAGASASGYLLPGHPPPLPPFVRAGQR